MPFRLRRQLEIFRNPQAFNPENFAARGFAATIKSRLRPRGIFAFVNKSCNFAADFKPIG